MAKAKTLPMKIDAETALKITLTLFREHMIFGTLVTAADIDFLEKAMNAYAALKYDAKGKIGPTSELVASIINGPKPAGSQK